MLTYNLKKIILYIIIATVPSSLAIAKITTSIIESQKDEGYVPRDIYIKMNDHEFIRNPPKQERKSTLNIEFLRQSFAEGPGVGGGGFSYGRAAIPLTFRAIDRIKKFLEQITQDEFETMQLKWPFKIATKSELLILLNKIEVDTETQVYIKTNIGMDPLMANFEGSDVSNGKIVLQPIFLTTFNREDSKSDEDRILRILLHECSHLFRIGLVNDDDSKNYSTALVARIIKSETHLLPEKMEDVIYSNSNQGTPIRTFVIAYSDRMSMNNQSLMDLINISLLETNKFKNFSEGNKLDDQSIYFIAYDVKSEPRFTSDVWQKLYPRICEKLTQILNNGRNYEFQITELPGPTHSRDSFQVCISKNNN